ncbi:rhodopsin, GQ-coupled isoform X2 [Nematostella vectensis]|nr:rhodopsin, GQ-coupled isoform X2 [Nematostella vectensis]
MASGKVPSWSDYLIGGVVTLLFLVTLLLNILALHYTYNKIKKPSNKKIPHLLVGALSTAGLGIALCSYPPFIASRFVGEWFYGASVCNFIAFIIVLFGSLTICLVVVMSVERLGAICFPFFYKEHVTFKKAVFLLSVAVVYSICLAALPIVLDNIRLNVSTGICYYVSDTHNTNTRVVVSIMVTHYLVSILVMFVSNMVVVRAVSKLDKNCAGEYSQRNETKQTTACISFAKMVAVLAVCYTICWTAILMRILLLYVYGWHNHYYDQVVTVLTTFDPLINHCVCLWIMRKYRDGYASSMGSIMSCFKISDDGVWATAITRLSSMSRRSTFSRASTRSSSRKNSKP